jgi:peptide/nickel transport system substrate-binding protein
MAKSRMRGEIRGEWARALGALILVALSGFAPPAAAAEKVFTYALAAAPESLDSAKTTSERAWYVTWLLCDALVNVSADGRRLEPGLAESWTLAADGLSATIRLRAGALFHDGSPIDAAAVKTSFERQFRPDSRLYTADPPNGRESMLRDLIQDIEVQGPRVLVFKLKYAGLHYLSQVDIVSPTALEKHGRDFGRKPACSGPFKVESWASDQLLLTAHAQYWAGRPLIDRVVFRFISDPKASVEALLKGEVDFTPLIRDPALLERAREGPRIKLLTVSALNTVYLGFYTERPPFDNVLVRTAVVRGIDVGRAVLFLMRGTAVPAKGPLPPLVRGYDPEVGQPSFDPQAARALLARAGHAAGLTVRLIYNEALSWQAEYAAAIQSDLRRIGVRVDLSGKPSYQAQVSAIVAREGDMFIDVWGLRAPHPERLLVPLFHSGAADSTNWTRYRNRDLDRLLDDARRLPEGPAQVKAYSKAQRVIVDDAPMVFLYHGSRMAAHADRVKGLSLNPLSLPVDKLVTVDLGP